MRNIELPEVDDSEPASMRGAERRTTSAPSTLRADGMRAIDVTVVDISTSGLGVETDADLRISDEISIGLPGVGTRRAFIAWRRGHRYGCAFYSPIEESEMTRAFVTANLVPLGGPQKVLVAKPSGSGAMAIEHSHWAMPLDAILVTLAYLAVAVGAIWHWVG